MFSYGFYNSLNGDRKYDAVQISSIFDGIIEDGVYSNVGEFFAVVPGTGMGVIVKTGRAWFNHTWSLNDSHLPMNIDEADVLQTRIDAVVLEVDARVENRENSIKIIKGVPSVNPLKPNLLNTGNVFQHALAYVTVKPAAETITASDIEIVVGKDETPFVQCPLKTVSLEDLWQQWDEEFNVWFDNLKATMTDNVVANLQRQIDEKVNIDDKATEEDIKNGTSDKWIDSSSFKSGTNIGNLIPVGETFGKSSAIADRIGVDFLPCDGSDIKFGKYPLLDQTDITNRYFKVSPVLSSTPPIQGVGQATQIYTMDIYCIGHIGNLGEYEFFGSKSNLYVVENGAQREFLNNVTCYMIYEDHLYVGYNQKLEVYDVSLNLLTTHSFTGYNVKYICPIESGQVLAIGSNGTNEIIRVSTDYFASSFVTTVNGQTIFGQHPAFFDSLSTYSGSDKRYHYYINSSKYEYHRPFSLVQKYKTKLYTIVAGAPTGSMTIVVSEDRGLTWRTLITYPAFVYGSSFGIYEDKIYILTNELSNGTEIRILTYDMNGNEEAEDLIFKDISRSDTTEMIIYGMSENKVFIITPLQNTQWSITYPNTSARVFEVDLKNKTARELSMAGRTYSSTSFPDKDGSVSESKLHFSIVAPLEKYILIAIDYMGITKTYPLTTADLEKGSVDTETVNSSYNNHELICLISRDSFMSSYTFVGPPLIKSLYTWNNNYNGSFYNYTPTNIFESEDNIYIDTHVSGMDEKIQTGSTPLNPVRYTDHVYALSKKDYRLPYKPGQYIKVK